MFMDFQPKRCHCSLVRTRSAGLVFEGSLARFVFFLTCDAQESLAKVRYFMYRRVRFATQPRSATEKLPYRTTRGDRKVSPGMHRARWDEIQSTAAVLRLEQSSLAASSRQGVQMVEVLRRSPWTKVP